MRKLIAIACVTGWGAFWAFGLIALFGGVGNGQMVAAILLAFAGMATGMTAYLMLSRGETA